MVSEPCGSLLVCFFVIKLELFVFVGETFGVSAIPNLKPKFFQHCTNRAKSRQSTVA